MSRAEPAAQSTWDLMLAEVQERVSEQTYRTWFLPLRPKQLEADQLTLEVPNPFFVDWLKEHHVDTLELAAASVLGEEVSIRFALSTDYADEALPRNPIPKEATAARAPAPVKPGAVETSPLNGRFTFDNFVVGKSNEFCFAACEAVANNPGQIYNPLFIYGGVGLGKTHIMQAIGSHLVAGPKPCSVQYVSSEKFMNEMIQSIRTGTTFDFKRRYRSTDLLLIDDIQFLAGKESTQEEFFHTFNSLYDAHKQIVITSDRPPRELRDLEERLVSRFNWGLVTDINPPDFETRVAILRGHAEREAVDIPDDVILLIAERITSNVRELEGSLVRLSALASLTKSRITIDLATSFLKDLMSRQTALDIGPERILDVVARTFDVGTDLVRGKRRTSKIVFPRQVGMYLTKRLTGTTYADIGAFYGGRDHTTVLYACEKIDRLRQDNPSLDRQLDELAAELEAGTNGRRGSSL